MKYLQNLRSLNLLRNFRQEFSKFNLSENTSFLDQWRSVVYLRKCNLHGVVREPEVKTIKEVINCLVKKTGATKTYSDVQDRSALMSILPKSQEEMPPRRMQDSFDCAIVPLGSDADMRDRYITLFGGVRVGRLLEDLDVFAVWLCYKHILNPYQREDLPSPHCVVTALVDRIDFAAGLQLSADKDIRLEGHVSWAGKSSLETTIDILQEIDGTWEKVTKAVFVMVARDPLNQGSAVINPLICETDEEKQIFQKGQVHKLSRKMIQKESLFNAPPSELEKTLVHDLFMSMASPEQLSFAPKNKPENSIWMDETKLKNIIICHPESSNIYGKIFGGFLMRKAFELSYSNATIYSKQRPKIMNIDDIMFKNPVEIGSMLYLNSQVVYTEGNHLHISTKASVYDAVRQTSNLTNIFQLTFEVASPVNPVIPKSYHEAMMYLDGRRHYQLVRGIRKFYSQGEKKANI